METKQKRHYHKRAKHNRGMVQISATADRIHKHVECLQRRRSTIVTKIHKLKEEDQKLAKKVEEFQKIKTQLFRIG